MFSRTCNVFSRLIKGDLDLWDRATGSIVGVYSLANTDKLPRLLAFDLFQIYSD